MRADECLKRKGLKTGMIGIREAFTSLIALSLYLRECLEQSMEGDE